MAPTPWRRARRPKKRVLKRPVLKPKVPDNPCPEHPGWERATCGHCGPRRLDHKVVGDFMRMDERRELEEKTGQRIGDRSDWKRVTKETGMREAERGEACYERFDALTHHAETGEPLAPEHTISNIDVFGKAVKKPNPNFNARERYEYHRQRLGLN